MTIQFPSVALWFVPFRVSPSQRVSSVLSSHTGLSMLPLLLPSTPFSRSHNLQVLTRTLPLKHNFKMAKQNYLGNASRNGIQRIPLIQPFSHHLFGVGDL